jgi:hypothetical protein
MVALHGTAQHSTAQRLFGVFFRYHWFARHIWCLGIACLLPRERAVFFFLVMTAKMVTDHLDKGIPQVLSRVWYSHSRAGGVAANLDLS